MQKQSLEANGIEETHLKARLPFFLPGLSGAVEACGMGQSAFSCPRCAAASPAVSPELHAKFPAANMGRSGLWESSGLALRAQL